MSVTTRVVQGDCLECLSELPEQAARLVYWDPPFFSQKVHRLGDRAGDKRYQFSDCWDGEGEYSRFVGQALSLIRQNLAADGSVFFHCDRRATHIARGWLDRVFGANNFRAEIIWHYRRWSNSQRALLPAHQTIYYYSKGADFVFHPQWGDYSPATNVDQLLQRRTRDARGKAVYERDGAGKVVSEGGKQGVPLSDVWDIPYLNPKASERVGYPTQKPLQLLERIVQLTTDPGDWVLDPCCGSGTALVAAARLGRSAVGIDRSEQAVELTRARLNNPIRSESRLMAQGRQSYWRVDSEVQRQLQGLDCVPVQRSASVDALLRRAPGAAPVPIAVQRREESVKDCARRLLSWSQAHLAERLIVVDVGYGGEAVEQLSATDPRLVVLRSLESQWNASNAAQSRECEVPLNA